jgi:hypothetical protein
MGIVDTIRNVADGAESVKRIHDTTKYFTDTYAKNSGCKGCGKKISIIAPATVKVNEPVTISGMGVGMVSLYSGDHLEREIFPDRHGEWYIRLYFSVKGTYLLKAKDSRGEAETTLEAL